MKKEHTILLAILVISTCILIYPLLKPGIPYSDDLRSHIFNFYSIHQNPLAHIYPTLYSGSVLYQFYSIFPYYLGLPLTWIFDIVTAMKAYMILLIVLTVGSMFLASYLLYRNYRVSTIAAIGYSWFSYFMISLTSRGALGEITGYALFPLALVCFMISLEKWDKKYIVYTIILSSLIILSSVPVAWELAFVFVLYIILHVKEVKGVSSNLIKSSVCVIVGILLLTIFWLGPFLADMKQMNFQDFYDKEGKSTLIGMPGNTGLALGQVFIYHFGTLMDGTRSFYIGYSLILLSIIGLLYYRSRQWTYLSIIALIMILIPPVLSIFPMASSLQFSFRLLLIVGLGMSMSAGLIVDKISRQFNNKWIIFVALALIILDFIPGLNFAYTNQDTSYFVNSKAQIDALSAIRADPEQFIVFSPTTQADYLYTGHFGLGYDWEGLKQAASDKIWTIYTDAVKNGDIQALGFFGVKYLMLPCFKTNMTLVNSNGEFCVYKNEYYRPIIEAKYGIPRDINIKPDSIKFNINTNETGQSLVKIFNFEGHWNYYVDGQNMGEPTKIVEFPYMLIDIPKGQHQIKIIYHNSKLQTYTFVISLVTLIGLLYWSRK